MVNLDELVQRIDAYRSSRMPLAEFANWFEDNSSAAHASPELKWAWSAVDAAFSQYHYDHIGEDAMKVELANAILPFVSLVAENRNVESKIAKMIPQSNAKLEASVATPCAA